jgi:hypothetical protein
MDQPHPFHPTRPETRMSNSACLRYFLASYIYPSLRRPHASLLCRECEE